MDVELRRKFIWFVCLLGLFPAWVKAQYDPSFVNYWALTSFYNPAATGQDAVLNVQGAYSMQMMGFENAPAVMLAHVDMPLFFINERHGAGVGFMNDQIGLFKHQKFYLQYAYYQPLWGGRLSGGIHLAMLSETFDGSELDLEDTSDPAFPTSEANGAAFDLNFGIQYHRQTGKYSSVTAGITGGYRKKFSMHNTTDISDNADSTVVSEKVSPSTVQNIPAFVGAGISYSTRTMTVGIDYSFQAYSSVNSGNALVEYKNMNRISAGISYTPNQYDVRHYWKRIQFLFGASVDDSYILTGKSEGLNWSVSAGMKFPFRNSNFLYWTLEYDRYGFPVTNRNTVSENCLSLTLGISFAEGWFIRRKFE